MMAEAVTGIALHDPEPGWGGGGTLWTDLAGAVAAQRRRAAALAEALVARGAAAAQVRDTLGAPDGPLATARRLEVLAYASMAPAAARALLTPPLSERFVGPLPPEATEAHRVRLGFAGVEAERLSALPCAELLGALAPHIDREDAAFIGDAIARSRRSEERLVAEVVGRHFDAVAVAEKEARAVRLAAAREAETIRWAAEAARWRSEGVDWAPLPELTIRFLREVPAALRSAWARLLALGASDWAAIEFDGPAACDEAGEPLPGAADCGVVLTQLAASASRDIDPWVPRALSRRRPRHYSDVRLHVGPIDWSYVGELLRRARRAAQGAIAPAAPIADADRKKAQRARDRKEVEAAYGGRCAACGRTRADGIAEFHLDHVVGNGGGQRRAVRTDALRRSVLAQVARHGAAPRDLELLCPRDHAYQTRFRARPGAPPWGDRVRIDSGESWARAWDGTDLPSPEELAATRPRPAPSC